MVEFPLSGKWFWIMETQRLLKVQKKMHQHLDWTSRMLCCVRSRSSREVEKKISHPFKRAGFFLSTGLGAKLLVDHSLHWKRPRLKNHPPLLRSENILSKFLFTISNCEWFPDVPMFFSNKNTPSWASLKLTATAMWKRHPFSGAKLALGSYRTNLFPESVFRMPIGIHGKMLKVYMPTWMVYVPSSDLAAPKLRAWPCFSEISGSRSMKMNGWEPKVMEVWWKMISRNFHFRQITRGQFWSQLPQTALRQPQQPLVATSSNDKSCCKSCPSPTAMAKDWPESLEASNDPHTPRSE